MNSVKKVLALLIALTVAMAPICSFAEGGSPTKTNISNAKIVWTDTSKVYNGKVQHASFKVTYGGKTLKKGTDYTVAWIDTGSAQCCTNPVVCKTHTNKVMIEGIGQFNGSKKASVDFKITKAKQTPIKFKTKHTVKRSKVKKKAVYISKAYTPKKLGTHKTGKVTCKKVSGSSKLSVTKSGKIKVKKGTKKGKYKIKIKATAAAVKNYKKGSTTRTVYVTVK